MQEKENTIIINKEELAKIKQIAYNLLSRDSRSLADGPINRDLFLLAAFQQYLKFYGHPVKFDVRT